MASKKLTTESDLLKTIQMRATENGSRLFRNTVGVGYSGKAIRISKQGVAEVMPGDVIVRAARTVTYGLGTGSGDLIGWNPVVIKPEHVGKTFARFSSLEIKKPGQRMHIRPEQLIWKEQVTLSGGHAAIVNSEQDYLESLRND